MESAIDRFFVALPDQKRGLTLYLRDIITEVHPKIVERACGTLKYARKKISIKNK